VDLAVAYDGETLDAAILTAEDVRPVGRCSLDRADELLAQLGEVGDLRWIWADTGDVYPRLLERGIRV
jgi:hypothetical protein